jgi:hypothetical protein
MDRSKSVSLTPNVCDSTAACSQVAFTFLAGFIFFLYKTDLTRFFIIYFIYGV